LSRVELRDTGAGFNVAVVSLSAMKLSKFAGSMSSLNPMLSSKLFVVYLGEFEGVDLESLVSTSAFLSLICCFG